MPILFALVACGTTVLAEHATSSGNFGAISRVILGKISPTDKRLSFDHDQHLFHCIVVNRISYLCLTNGDFPRRMAFAFLDDVSERFHKTHGHNAHTALEHEMNNDFGRVLGKQMECFSDPATDRILQVREDIDTTRGIMAENLEKVLNRGEKMELLADKTDSLGEHSKTFKRSSVAVMRGARFRTWKLKLTICGLVFSLIVIVVTVVLIWLCGIDGKKCRN